MRTADLERRTGVDRHTLRFYEKEGLLTEVQRDACNNYRDYPEIAVDRVRFIRDMQSMGFSLGEIRDILQAMRAGNMDCEQGARLVAEKARLVDEQIARLSAIHQTLAREQRRLEASAARLKATGRC